MAGEKKAIKELKSSHALVLSNLTRDIAIKAIEKQIPTAPISKIELGQYVVYCPNCNCTLFDVDWCRKTQEKYHINFCICCGQRLTKPTRQLGCWEG